MNIEARKAKLLEKAEARNAAVMEALASTAGPPTDGELADFRNALAGAGIQLAYDVRAERPTMKAAGTLGLPKEWEVVNDRREDLAKCVLEAMNDETYSREKWRQLVNAHLQTNEVDPVLRWLEALPPWDGEKRIHKVLRVLFGPEENAMYQPLQDWASAFIFLGPTERAFHPASKQDEVAILYGPQGTGKSSLLEHAFDSSLGAHNTVSLGADEKVFVEASLGKAIMEASEMAGVHKAETEKVKMVLSRKVDTTRLSYARHPVDRARRFSVIGTTNREDSLPFDASGSRRFVIASCAGEPWTKDGMTLYQSYVGPVEDWLAEHREQLFAEAVREVKQGTAARLPKRLRHLQEMRNQSHQPQDEWALGVVDSLDSRKPHRLVDIIGVQGENPSDWRMQRRIADALKLKGWSRKQWGKKRQKHWAKDWRNV